MANTLYENRPYKELWLEDAEDIAKVLYNADYRKTSDVAREIIDELSSYCDAKWREARDKSNYAMLNYNNEEIRIWLNRQRAYEDVESKIAELKKKYESERDK